MKEYVGCKVEHNRQERWIKLTQPVMIQRFEDEFELPDDVPSYQHHQEESLPELVGVH
jgi:hypothetical protein